VPACGKTATVRLLALSLCLLLTVTAAAARSNDPRIEQLTSTAVNGKVSVRFILSHAFEAEQIIQGLQSGVPTSFTYVIEIFRDRPNWFDDGISRSRVEVITTYNSLTREYLLNYRRDHKLVRSETFSDLATLQQRMTSIDERDLFDVGKRRPYKLKVRVKADLSHSWLLYFIPWETSTRWREVRVTEPKP
jgi:hypothetical protein